MTPKELGNASLYLISFISVLPQNKRINYNGTDCYLVPEKWLDKEIERVEHIARALQDHAFDLSNQQGILLERE